MSYKILRTYLSPDIVDYCVLPFLYPKEEEVKEKYKYYLRADFKMIMMYTFLDDECLSEHESANWEVLTVLRKKYYDKNKWWLSDQKK